MSLHHFSEFWTSSAPAMGNHLWQSTFFAAVAGLLTLILRKNQARTRYWLWLAASAKFLIPFSLLVAVGGSLAWSRPAAPATAQFYVSLERFSQPFSQPAANATSAAAPVPLLTDINRLIPVLIAVTWFGGFVVILFTWSIRWRRISNSMRHAMPLNEGREVEALRNAARFAGMQRHVPLLLSPDSLEPGIFGILNPVLVWPRGISARLDEDHLESILAHELCHVRRHDNLAAAIHMAVEAIFWFHPIVWWVGMHMVAERELACDEAVLEMGSKRQVYAESILRICEFCVSSPLNCISGVTGPDLKKRITHIMLEEKMPNLNLGKKLLLFAACLAVVATPLMYGLLNAAESRGQTPAGGSRELAAPRFESSSIKLNVEGTASLATGAGIIPQRMVNVPGEFAATNAPIQDLLKNAFGVKHFQLSGVPDEFGGKLFDVEAKASPSTTAGLQKLDKAQRELQSQRMAQAFLVDRLHLQFHKETKEMPAYALTVVTPGLLPEDGGECAPGTSMIVSKLGEEFTPPCGNLMSAAVMGRLSGKKISMERIVFALSELTQLMVVDQTNLTGKYEVDLKWNPDPGMSPEYTGPRPPADPNGPTLEKALQQKLGLRLEPRVVPVELLVIDHIEMPTAD